MNFILCPVRNNLALTQKAIETFRSQDIGGVQIFVINNASTDNTGQWLATQRDLVTMYFDPPLSVAESWNYGLQWVFRHGAEYCLVVNNDTELRPDTYRRLVDDGGGFVTAVGVRERKLVFNSGHYEAPDPAAKRPHPDFSCYLIYRWVYEKVAPFDENFKIAFCEDGDYDLRMYKAGIRAYCLDLPYLHHGSMTIKNAGRIEEKWIARQAELNRAYFKKKWGFAMASPEYYRALDKDRPIESSDTVPSSDAAPRTAS